MEATEGIKIYEIKNAFGDIVIEDNKIKVCVRLGQADYLGEIVEYIIIEKENIKKLITILKKIKQ